MSKPVGLTHILTELSSLDDLGALLRRSARLKYTCISASKKYLALGSNTGGVYIFSRETLKYQQVVYADSNSSPIVSIRLSPSSQHIATAVSTGRINVFELNIECRSKPERVRSSIDHTGHTVTVMTWASTGQKLFVGDDSGKLSVILVPNKKAKTLFAMPTEVIAYLDASIFQMGWWDNKLLVSSLTNCYLFDTNRHNFSSIGSKKRDGAFGACIFLEPASLYPVIYCARPGSRIWEVDFEGKVLNTHLFKQLLAIPPVPVLNIMSDSYSPSTIETQGSQSVTFSKMIPLGSLILTWSSKGLYLLDPINVKVIVWTDSILGIKDIALYGNDAYLFLENSSVRRLSLLSIYPLFQLLASRSRWSVMSCLLLASDQINLHASIIKRVRKDLFETMVNGLKESGNLDMVERLYGMMDDVSESSIHSISLGDDFMGAPPGEEVMLMGHTTLPSGMVVVSEGFSMDALSVDPSVGWDAEKDYDGMMSEVESVEDLEVERNGGGEFSGGQRDNGVFGGDGDSNIEVLEEDGGVVKMVSKNCKTADGEMFVVGGDEEESSDFVAGSRKQDSVVRSDGGEVLFEDNGEEIGRDHREEKCRHAGRNGKSLMAKRDEHGEETIGNFSDDDDDRRSDSESGDEFFQDARDSSGNWDNNVEKEKIVCIGDVSEKDIQNSRDATKLNGDCMHQETEHKHIHSEDIDNDEDEKEKNPLQQTINDPQESGNKVNGKGNFDTEKDGSECVVMPSSNERVSVPNDSTSELNSSRDVNVNSDVNDAMLNSKHNGLSTSSSAGFSDDNNMDDSVKGKANVDDCNIYQAQNSPVNSNKSSSETGAISESKINIKSDNDTCDNNDEAGFSDQRMVNGDHGDSSSQDSTMKQGDTVPSSDPMPNTKNTARRFSNVEIRKGETDIIAQAVRKPKKKKKTKASTIDLQERNVPDSLRKKEILRSASCDDLIHAHTSLYQHHNEKDADAISISTIDSIEENENEVVDEGTTAFTASLSSSTSYGTRETSSNTRARGVIRNNSCDTLFLTDDPDLAHLRSRRSVQTSMTYHEEKSSSQGHAGHHVPQVIPPLIDRLAAAKSGGDRRHAFSRAASTTTTTLTTIKDGGLSGSTSSLTDSGEFSALMSQLPSSLSAMKDGLSLKLKNQTRHFIKSFKEKNPLTVKSPTSPLLLSPHSTRKGPLAKDSSLPSPNQSEESMRPVDHATHNDTRRLSEVDRERMSLEEAALSVVKDELESLYKKAVYIQTAVKTSNLAMQPVVFKSVLNRWCRKLNAVMYKYLKELNRRKKENEKEKEKMKKNTGNDDDEEKEEERVGGEVEVESKEGETVSCDNDTNTGEPNVNYTQHADSLELNNSQNTNNNTMMSSDDMPSTTNTSRVENGNSNGSNISSSEQNYDRDSDSCPSSSHHHHHHPAASMEQDPSVLFISQLVHVNDPFHLDSKQKQAFHDLCTLGFLIGATGDFFNTFQISQQFCHCQQLLPIIQEFLPEHLQSPFVDFRNNNNDDKDAFLSSIVRKIICKELRSNSKTSLCPCQSFCCRKETSNHSAPLSLDRHQTSCPIHRYSHDDNGASSQSEEVVVVCDSSERDRTTDNEESNGIVEGRGVDGQNKNAGGSLTNDQQMEDLEAAVFLRVYFFLLDYDLIKQHLNKWCSSKYLTWTSLITCCHEKGKNDIVSSLLSDRQTNAAIDYLRSGILMHPQALIGHLYRLFQYTPGKAAEFCSEVRTSITGQEVVAMCVLSDKSPTDAFLRYLKKYIIDLPFYQRSNEFGILCDTPVIRLVLLHALLPSGDSKKEGAKKDGQDLASNVISVLPSDWLEQILTKVTSPKEQDLVLHLCLTLRQWKPCIQLMSRGEDKKSLIDLLVTVGDMDLVSKDGYIPQTTDEWRLLLSCFLQIQNEKSRKRCSSIDDDDDDNNKENHHPATDSFSTTSAITDHDNPPQIEDSDNIGYDDSNDVNRELEKKLLVEKNNGKKDLVKDENAEDCCTSSSTAAKRQEAADCNNAEELLHLPPPAFQMTWESLTNLLVRHLGGAAAVEILCQQLCCSSGGGDGDGKGGMERRRADGKGTSSSSLDLNDRMPLSSSLLQACLADFSVESEQNQVCHEMLELLSVHMWTKKSGFLPPSVGHVITAETKSKDGGPKVLEEDLACDRQISLLQSTSSKVLMSENFGVHWGQEVNMKQTCQSCQMPLRLVVSHDVPGVVLFPCGDAFHKKCCAGSFCPIFH